VSSSRLLRAAAIASGGVVVALLGGMGR
jgi:hypothetical protein